MNRPQALRTRVTLAVSLVLLVAAIGVTLSRSPATVASTNPVISAGTYETVTGGHFGACQRNETLPAGTTAIRLSLDSVLGPRVTVRALSGKRLLTSGERSTGWTAGEVTVPVKPVARTVNGVVTCFEFIAKDESVALVGQRAAAGASAQSAAGAIKIEYLRPGEQSWWSLAATVATHMGSGRAWAGTWIVPFLAVLVGAILLAVCRLSLRLAR
jgi:hypothetical protein